MTVCNNCGGQMRPDDSALVPALGCVECGRLIPLTGVKHAGKAGRAEMNRVLRAGRRASAAKRHS